MSEKRHKKIPSKRADPHSRFQKKLVLQIVKEVEEGLTRNEACNKYGMSYSTLCDWISKFGSESYQALKRPLLSNQQKRNIARAIQEGRMTKDDAHLIYKVDKRTLSQWIQKKKQQDNELVRFNENNMAATQINYSGTDLQNELAEARLKIRALETMIDIAEEQFKIAIRKKPGAKQLQK